MATWLLNFVKAGTPHKKQLVPQARHLLEIGLWGIPPTSPATKNVKPGDRVIAYVGAPERVFIGDAVVKDGYHYWGPQEATLYPSEMTFDAGISLRDVQVWNKPVPLASIWPSLTASQKNPNAHFMQATHQLLEQDGDLVLNAGRNGTAAGAPPQPVAPVAPAVTAARPTVVMEPPPTTPPPTAETTPNNPQAAAFYAVVQELRAMQPGASINEETTRAFLLNKYFHAMGYTSLSDIAYGEPAKSANFPDYVLKVDGKNALAVEAKALGTTLGDKEAGQVTGYCGTLGVRWGLLTDGRLFKLYDAHVLSPEMDDRLVLELDLSDYRSAEDFDISIWSVVQMLSKQQMKSGHELEHYAAREAARRILTDPDSAAVAALGQDLAKQKLNYTPAQVAQLVEEVLGS